MDESRLNTWEALFRRALQILDSTNGVIRDGDWTFGGGTVLMRRYAHRFSKDVDIFVPIRNTWAISLHGSTTLRRSLRQNIWKTPSS